MVFYAPGHEPIQVALLSGHIAIVPPDGADLPRHFHEAAVAAGCLTERDAPAQEAGGPDRRALIKQAIQTMIDTGDTTLFTRAGYPVLAKLSKFAGFSVERTEAERIFQDEFQRAPVPVDVAQDDDDDA
jgi:hypothetical protein